MKTNNLFSKCLAVSLAAILLLAGGANAGGQMKSMTLWNAPNEGATNTSGFTALPGGMRATSFIQNNMHANYWTSTPEGTSTGYFFYQSYDNGLVEQDFRWGSNGLSIRCVQD